MSESLETKSRALAERLRGLSPSTVSKPTLVYLDIVGLGWPIRAALHVSGVEHEDIRVNLTEWLGMTPADYAGGKEPVPQQETPKEATKTKHLPYYCDPDVELQHSTVILRYLGKKYNMWADNPSDELNLEQVLVQVYDMLFHYTGIFQANQKAVYGMKPAEYHAGQIARFNDTKYGGYHKNLRVLQSYLEQNQSGKGFIVGDKLTVGDLAAFNVLTFWYKMWSPEVFVSTYPLLEEYIQRIARIPAIEEYNKKRCPQTWIHGEWGTLGHCEKFGQVDGHVGLAHGL